MDEHNSADADRRRFLKRAGIVAGTTVWATPVVQSLGSAAFATGSPAPCTSATLIRFKYDVGGGFDSGQPPADSPAGACTAQVTGYNATLPGRAVNSNGYFVDGNCRVKVTVTLSPNKKTATVTVTNGTLLDVDIKGGVAGNKDGYCFPGAGAPNGGDSTITLKAPFGGAAISFVAGVICPTC